MIGPKHPIPQHECRTEVSPVETWIARVVDAVNVGCVHPSIQEPKRVDQFGVADELPAVVDLDQQQQQQRIEAEQGEWREEEITDCRLDPVQAERRQEVQ